MSCELAVNACVVMECKCCDAVNAVMLGMGLAGMASKGLRLTKL